MEIISHVPQVVAQEWPKYKLYQVTNLFKGTHCKPECMTKPLMYLYDVLLGCTDTVRVIVRGFCGKSKINMILQLLIFAQVVIQLLQSGIFMECQGHRSNGTRWTVILKCNRKRT